MLLFSIERLEDARNLVGRDAGAGVVDADVVVAGAFLQGDEDLPFLVHGLGGVLAEVHEDLPKLGGVGQHGAGRLGQARGDV
jgi:hypothetical protein